MSTARTLLLSSVLFWLLVSLRPPAAHACAVDNVASLAANGTPAMLAAAPPVPGRLWAPFVLAQAFAPGSPVRLQESHADLTRTLPAAVLAAPFRWTFGDGTTAFGYKVVHRYAKPGQYHLLVYGFYHRERRWFAFDSALVRIVPAGQLLRANLEYEALQAVIALSSLTWPIDGVLIFVVVILLFRLNRRSHRASEVAAESGA